MVLLLTTDRKTKWIIITGAENKMINFNAKLYNLEELRGLTLSALYLTILTFEPSLIFSSNLQLRCMS
jgi:hypothetical protein